MAEIRLPLLDINLPSIEFPYPKENLKEVY
jgi:hypothetical protein